MREGFRHGKSLHYLVRLQCRWRAVGQQLNHKLSVASRRCCHQLIGGWQHPARHHSGIIRVQQLCEEHTVHINNHWWLITTDHNRDIGICCCRTERGGKSLKTGTGNAVLAGIPLHLARRLQSVMNAAARLVLASSKCNHITPLLTPITLAESSMSDRLQAGRSGLQMSSWPGTVIPRWRTSLSSRVGVSKASATLGWQ